MAHLPCDLVDSLFDAHGLNASIGKSRKDFETLVGGSAESIQSFDDGGMHLGRLGKLLGDVPVATAILDRFLHHADVISITGESHRLPEECRACRRAQWQRSQEPGQSRLPGGCQVRYRAINTTWV